MNRLRYLLLLAAVLAGQFFAFARPTYACSCIMPPPPQQAMADSAVVFAGRVVEAPPAAGGGVVSSADLLPYTFEVTQVWKGDADPFITVRTARDSASCGFNFEAGQEYIVYAYVGEALLETNLCTRTAPLATAEEDLAALGEGTVPDPAEQPAPADAPEAVEVEAEDAGLSTVAWLLMAVGLAILFAIPIALVQRRRTQA